MFLTNLLEHVNIPNFLSPHAFKIKACSQPLKFTTNLQYNAFFFLIYALAELMTFLLTSVTAKVIQKNKGLPKSEIGLILCILKNINHQPMYVISGIFENRKSVDLVEN